MLGVFSFCLMYVFKALFKLASQEKEVETLVEEKPAGEASQARGKGTTQKGKGKAKAVVKKSRKSQIDELVQSDNDEEKQEDQDEAAAGLLTEI